MSRFHALMGAALVSTALTAPSAAFADTALPLCVEANTSTGYALPAPKEFTLAALPAKRPQNPDMCITPNTQRFMTLEATNRILSVYSGLAGGFASSDVLPPLAARFKAKGKAAPEMEISSSGLTTEADGAESLIYFFTVAGAKGEFVTGQMRLLRDGPDKQPLQPLPYATPADRPAPHSDLMI